MEKIRDNITFLNFDDLGRTTYQGPVEVKGLGTVHLDVADTNYINETLAKGIEPAVFVSPSPALKGWYVVISRQRSA